MILLQDYEKMIGKLAYGCLRRLPVGSWDIDDLEQEGRIIFIKLKRKRINDKAKFGTLFYSHLMSRYQNIVRDTWRSKRCAQKNYTLMYNIEDQIQDNRPNQEDELSKKEIIQKISEINPDFADMLANGVSEELFKLAKHEARLKALRNKRKVGAIMFTKKIIEKFFGCNLNKILEIIHQHNH